MPDLADGESVEVKGSAAKPYVLTNTGGVYSCSCPAWRNQSAPIERRTCKHLRKYRGEQAEKDRLGGELPARATKSSAKKDAPPLLLAQSWDNSLDLTDWWMSEKLDGVRAYWDGKRFLSRQGNEYLAPKWFTEDLPSTPLDGELWIARQKFQRTVSVVRRQDRSDHWRDVKYLIFDAPQATGNFEERMEFLADAFGAGQHEFAGVHEHERCRDESHLRSELARVESLGGEGLMLRQPESDYAIGRSSTLLKVKTFHDAEAIVLDHHAGKGKHKGKLGALTVQLPDGTEFSVGTGFTDAERAAPPEVGSTITFRYQELSDAGVPRFPSYVRQATGTTTKAIPSPAAKPTQSPSISTVSPAAAGGTTTNPTTPSTSSTPRYFELEDERSSKFWEISLADTEVTVRYGRIGTQGTTKVRDLEDADKAQAHFDKLVDQKTSKGYVAAQPPQ